MELPIGVTYLIPEDEPVRLMWEVLEGIDFSSRKRNDHMEHTGTIRHLGTGDDKGNIFQPQA